MRAHGSYEGRIELSETSRHLSPPQLLRPLGCTHHRLNQSHAQTAFFQFENAVDGAASRRSHRVLEQCRMVAGFQHHLRRADVVCAASSVAMSRGSPP